MILYYNGEYVSGEDLRISPFDHGFLYGLGLFETFRVYNKHPFLLDDHLNRLRRSLEECQIQWKMTNSEVFDVLQELLDRNNLQNGYIRLNVSAGVGHIGLQTEPYSKPNTIFFIKEMPETTIGEKIGVLLSTPRNTPEGNVRLKSHHYLNNVIGKREVGDSAFKEGLFLTKDGHLAEGVVSNLFFLKGDKLYTPSLQTGVLNGVTRQFVLNWCTLNKVQYEEGLYTVDDLLSSDEVFVTNSIQEIVPISSVENVHFKGKSGEFVKTLQLAYKSYTSKLFSMSELK
ncbi:aminodeoxychorismate lyase [Bacillus sp. RG28]|uniref:Aminodeoxychorismate lyase n=1 Tax=Gottfriedia endophytica TaxID=2820819 RepID=A0A940NTH0_9BACI|nr:aminodeoxychorismate lyase [Gottfriedia endophytica]MBP0727238.1 aminodeoxychorismate lyase [Gottfriedia endophytica]